MTENFLLETIADNPYQPRTVDNTEHIENLARSIAADGTLATLAGEIATKSKSWKIKIPAAFTKLAEQMDAEIDAAVSAETPSKK